MDVAVKKISVGIDRSATAANALRWACGFATSSGASVRALSIWQMPLIAMLPDFISGQPTEAFMRERAQTTLDTTLAKIDTTCEIETLVVDGAPGEVLVKEAETAGLTVVGRTGEGRRRGIARFSQILIGSVARYCVHHADGPIVAVPTEAEWNDHPTVVVGIDGSDESVAALRWAIEHLPATAEVHAVRVMSTWLGETFGIDTDPDAMMDGLVDAAQSELQSWVDEGYKKTKSDLATAPQAHVIVGRATDDLADPGFPVDLIVVGERGHTGVAARVLGSVSDHLVRNAHCPVVVVSN